MAYGDGRGIQMEHDENGPLPATVVLQLSGKVGRELGRRTVRQVRVAQGFELLPQQPRQQVLFDVARVTQRVHHLIQSRATSAVQRYQLVTQVPIVAIDQKFTNHIQLGHDFNRNT